MGVEVIIRHGIALGVGQTISTFIATDGWINPEREQVLVVLSQNTIMDRGAPRN